jgi:hypothetical protein
VQGVFETLPAPAKVGTRKPKGCNVVDGEKGRNGSILKMRRRLKGDEGGDAPDQTESPTPLQVQHFGRRSHPRTTGTRKILSAVL